MSLQNGENSPNKHEEAPLREALDHQPQPDAPTQEPSQSHHDEAEAVPVQEEEVKVHDQQHSSHTDDEKQVSNLLSEISQTPQVPKENDGIDLEDIKVECQTRSDTATEEEHKDDVDFSSSADNGQMTKSNEASHDALQNQEQSQTHENSQSQEELKSLGLNLNEDLEIVQVAENNAEPPSAVNINDNQQITESFIGGNNDDASFDPSQPLASADPNLNLEQLNRLQENVEQISDKLMKMSQSQDSIEEDQEKAFREEQLRLDKQAMKKQMLEALFGRVDNKTQENAAEKMRKYQKKLPVEPEEQEEQENGNNGEVEQEMKAAEEEEPVQNQEEQEEKEREELEKTEEQIKQEIAKEEERKRKERLQKEIEALKAPVQSMINSNQEKREKQEALAAAQAAATLRYKENKKDRPTHEIAKVITVDSYVLNYGTFMPGKLLGSTLSVVNESSFEQIVELSIDAASFNYNKKTISEKYDVSDLPFSFELSPSQDSKKQQSSNGTSNNDNIVNSEFKHECWYIENPISRELTKRITLKLGPKAEQEFIVVLRCPTNNVRRLENLLSIINIGLLTYADEEFGGRDSFDDLLKIRYGSSMKEFLRERKKLAQIQKLEVLLAGRVEVPGPLVCPRELLMTEYKNEKVVPIVVKKGPQSGTGAQKFRLPFKNMGSQEIEVEFKFAQQSAVILGPQPVPKLKGEKDSGSSSSGSLDNKKENSAANQQQQLTSSPIELSVVPPATMKVPPNGGSIIINLAAKLKNSYQLQALKESKQLATVAASGQTIPPRRPEKYTHLMTARIKDTQIVFSFIIEATIIEATGAAAMS